LPVEFEGLLLVGMPQNERKPPMPEFISSLDEQFISVKAVAQLVARERPELSIGELMDTFTHAIFSREFEPSYFSALRKDEANWMMHMRIEKALPDEATRALPVEKQPQAFYAVGAATVMEILDGRRALPCDLGATPRGRREYIEISDYEKTLGALASTPFSAFPDSGRAILGDILISRAHLRTWMIARRHRMPQFLAMGRPEPLDQDKAIEEGEQDETEQAAINGQPEDAASSNCERGRPPKAAWDRIIEIARTLHTKYPKLKRCTLAHDARSKALKEFHEKDLPSLTTIERRMKDIIGT
jgi:hypothetical protein